jgi:hypothetical protein
MSETSRITTLDSGLRVATETMASVQTASVGIWVDVGARYEAPEVNGVAHMLEHMAFKGTERRSARAIAEAIENVGGHLNAYTSREHTAYYARVMADDLPLAVDLLADILQHSAFDEAELARERGVVVQEIGQVQDTPDDLVFDLFQETAFPGQPLGRSILGPAELVAAMPRSALVDYMAQHYGPSRLVLSAAGKVEHERLVELADRLFRELPTPAVEQISPARYESGERREDRELEQVHLLIGLPAFSYLDDDFYALQVFSTMLGGGMSSRLFQEVRVLLRLELHRHRPVRHLRRHRRKGDRRPGAGGLRRAAEADRAAAGRGAGARAGAAQGEPDDGARELLCAERGARAPAPDLRPPDPAGRDRRQDQCGRRKRAPPGRAPPAHRRRADLGRDRSAAAAAGSGVDPPPPPIGHAVLKGVVSPVQGRPDGRHGRCRLRDQGPPGSNRPAAGTNQTPWSCDR